MSRPYLSLIIPVYNEAKRLPITLAQVMEFLHQQEYSFEVIVVENGSQDLTLAIAREFEARDPRIKVLVETARGKGLAVRRGMLVAQGEYRFMCDADFSMPVTEINRFLPPHLNAFDIAIASREAPGAVRYDEPQYRHVVGRIYNTLIRLIALPGLHDTQCGFKCFRGEVADRVFHQQTMTGWSFDVEVLFIAQRLGYRIVEIPIPWYFNADSKINVLRDSLKMGLDLITIRWNNYRGRYQVART